MPFSPTSTTTNKWTASLPLLSQLLRKRTCGPHTHGFEAPEMYTKTRLLVKGDGDRTKKPPLSNNPPADHLFPMVKNNGLARRDRALGTIKRDKNRGIGFTNTNSASFKRLSIANAGLTTEFFFRRHAKPIALVRFQFFPKQRRMEGTGYDKLVCFRTFFNNIGGRRTPPKTQSLPLAH